LEDDDPRKAADEWKFESVYTRKMGEFINPYAAFTGRSQFTAGYDYSVDPKFEISNFMDPGYFTQSAGIGYKPNDIIETRLGAAVKETIVGSEDTALVYADGDDPRVEYGAESITDVTYPINETTLFTSKLEAFSNLKGLDEIDVMWDNQFTSKISDLINVSLNIKIYYDKDISAERQLSQTLALGVSYTLF